jgi:hypothetical protein
MTRIFAAAAGFAALAAAAPSTAQYYGYGYSPYNNYGYNSYSYGYMPYAVNTQAAASQCTAAVQNRLYTRQGLSGVIGSLLGAYATTPRVLSVTRVVPRYNGLTTVRGLASSGRGYAYGYGYNSADLTFRCDVDARGYVHNVDINRRY